MLSCFSIFEYSVTILCSEFVFCPRHFIQNFTCLYNLKNGSCCLLEAEASFL